MIVAGIGCGHETSSEDIVSLISVALSNFGIAPENLTAIATETSKADQPGIAGAAAVAVASRCSMPDRGSGAGRRPGFDPLVARPGDQGCSVDRGGVRAGRGRIERAAARRAGRGQQGNLCHCHR